MPRLIFVYHSWSMCVGGMSLSIQCLEAQDVAKHSTVSEMASTTSNYTIYNVNTAEVENPDPYPF